MNIQQRILKFINTSNWILLLITSVIGGTVAKFYFTLGIIAGGLLVTINFHLMYRTLKKALTPPHLASPRSIFAKYYFRFICSVFIIYLLVSRNYVDPGGLLIGLSIVVASIMVVSLLELKKIIFKEAV